MKGDTALNVLDYATRTVFTNRKNADVNGYWNFAMDIGYSGVKGMSPNKVYCFPSFARIMKGKTLDIGDADPKDILYRDETGTVWSVGATAQNNLSARDTDDSNLSLYGRDRYYQPMFLVIARTGMGIGMIENEFGNPNGKIPVLQSGLPPKYLEEDAKYFKDVLAGRHCFDLKIGKNKWQHFDFELTADHIFVTQQPMGSFLGAAIDNEGRLVKQASKLFSSNVLVMDIGFGTLDFFSIRKRQMNDEGESFGELGMKSVLQDLSDSIFKKYNTRIPVHTMQKNLREGYITIFDRKNMKTQRVDFKDMLQESTTKICHAAIEKMISLYNSLIDYDYLLVTGGTGAAWITMIKNYFAGMETLTVLGANQNDDLPYIFANVRGYYVYLAGFLRAQKAKESRTESHAV